MANAKVTSRPQGLLTVRTYRAEGGALAHRLAVMQGTADDQAKVVTGAGVACVGLVLENAGAAAAGDLVSIVTHGEAIGIAGEDLAPGMWLIVDTNGKLTDGSGTDAHFIGQALSTAAADTDEVLVDVNILPKRS